MDTSGTGPIAPRGGRRNEGIVHTSNKVSAPVSDQVTGFAAVVVPGTIRDSLFILDGLLEQATSLQPEQVATDTASYSDQVFGLFRLLGYQFSPRLADLSDQRFWRMDPLADYGALNGLARSRVSTPLLADHWEDLLRVTGSLATGAVRASEDAEALARDAQARGWISEAERHRRLIARLDAVIGHAQAQAQAG